MRNKNHRRIGNDYEDWAAAYLKEEGYEILERNFCCRSGEIDIVAREKGYLVFVEVKYRSTGMCGSAAEAVTLQKQRRVRSAAMIYMQKRKLSPDIFCRFDVVAIDGTGLQLIRNAF